MSEARELTHNERAAIKKLVVSDCANFDRSYGCLPLENPCYMLGKCWTGSYCKYFRNAILPLDPVLEAALSGGSAPVPDLRQCAVCGEAFPVSGRQAYCSNSCKGKAQRRQQREYMRKKRYES